MWKIGRRRVLVKVKHKGLPLHEAKRRRRLVIVGFVLLMITIIVILAIAISVSLRTYRFEATYLGIDGTYTLTGQGTVSKIGAKFACPDHQALDDPLVECRINDVLQK